INICKSCIGRLSQDKLPKWALANKNWRGVELLPTHVRRPGVFEERALCPIVLLVLIIKLQMEYTRRTGRVIPGTQLLAVVGGCVSFEGPSLEFNSVLPVLLDD